MDPMKNTRRAALTCVLLGAVTLAAFWPVIHNDFVSYDDREYVTQNPHVLAGWTWANAGWAFRTGHAGNWHPLTWLSHILDVQLFGLRPAWHHLTSLLLHAVNAVLLLILLRRLTGAFWRSLCVGALFALHPLHVESVAWVAERKDVLSAFFFLLTLWAYAKYAEVQSPMSKVQRQEAKVQGPKSNVQSPAAGNGSQNAEAGVTHHAPRITAPASRLTPHASRITHHAPLFYILSLVCFALGLMSKPMLVTLPFILLLLDYWP